MKKCKSMILLVVLSLSLPMLAMAQGHHGGHHRPHHGDHRPHHGDHRPHHGDRHHGGHFYHGHPGKFWRWSVAWWAPVVKPCYYWHGHCHVHPRYFR